VFSGRLEDRVAVCRPGCMSPCRHQDVTWADWYLDPTIVHDALPRSLDRVTRDGIRMRRVDNRETGVKRIHSERTDPSATANRFSKGSRSQKPMCAFEIRSRPCSPPISA
jgi:hypothetical protein